MVAVAARGQPVACDRQQPTTGFLRNDDAIRAAVATVAVPAQAASSGMHCRSGCSTDRDLRASPIRRTRHTAKVEVPLTPRIPGIQRAADQHADLDVCGRRGAIGLVHRATHRESM